MLERRCIFLYILILALTLNAQSQGPQDPHKKSEVNLTITSDAQEIIIGEEVNIYFNFTNMESDENAYANGLNFTATLSDSLAAPKRPLLIKNIGNQENDPIEGYIEIYSNFNDHHSLRGDYATIWYENAPNLNGGLSHTVSRSLQ